MGATIEYSFEETESVWCLGGEIRQVFANLIGNAVDASTRGGTVVLRTRDAVDAKTGRRGVRVTVADRGIGMSRETRDRLFEPFYTTKEDTGTGLGLWVSEEILRRHEAKLSLRSRHGVPRSGTVFSILFPLTGGRRANEETAGRKMVHIVQ